MWNASLVAEEDGRLDARRDRGGDGRRLDRSRAGQVGVRWDQDALAMAVESTAGYPFLVQVHGDAIWRVAQPNPDGVITSQHVRTGTESAGQRLQPMFRGRWAKASPAEQRFLGAMAAAGDGALAAAGDGAVARADLARALDEDSRALSVVRARLIDKGLIEAHCPIRDDAARTIRSLRGCSDRDNPREPFKSCRTVDAARVRGRRLQ